MTDTRGKVLCIHPDDDMLVALVDLHPGDTVEWAQQPLRIRTPVQRKHEVARRNCAPGDILRLYGTPVGKATKPIGAGCAVTIDNLEHYAPAPVLHADTPAPVWSATGTSGWNPPRRPGWQPTTSPMTRTTTT